MSSLQSVFDNFKNHLKIPGNIVLLKKYEEKNLKLSFIVWKKISLLTINLLFWCIYIESMDFFDEISI